MRPNCSRALSAKSKTASRKVKLCLQNAVGRAEGLVSPLSPQGGSWTQVLASNSGASKSDCGGRRGWGVTNKKAWRWGWGVRGKNPAFRSSAGPRAHVAARDQNCGSLRAPPAWGGALLSRARTTPPGALRRKLDFS